jgi:hypothetical protein
MARRRAGYVVAGSSDRRPRIGNGAALQFHGRTEVPVFADEAEVACETGGDVPDARIAGVRMSARRSRRRVAKIPRRPIVAIALCGIAMPAMAADLMQALPHLWASAAALSLTLVTAASKPRD